LWLAAFRQLGPARTANGFFFNRGPARRVEGGVYRWLRDPMYTAYALALVGLGLWRRNAAYPALAAEAYALLEWVEAPVENAPFTPSPSGRAGVRAPWTWAPVSRRASHLRSPHPNPLPEGEGS